MWKCGAESYDMNPTLQSPHVGYFKLSYDNRWIKNYFARRKCHHKHWQNLYFFLSKVSWIHSAIKWLTFFRMNFSGLRYRSPRPKFLSYKLYAKQYSRNHSIALVITLYTCREILNSAKPLQCSVKKIHTWLKSFKGEVKNNHNG